MNCDCIAKANKCLAEHNTYLDAPESYNTRTGKTRVVMIVPTLKLNKKVRKIMRVIAKFCPLCGVKTESA